MPFDPYLQKALLDWTTGAAAVTQPTALWLAYESGSPQYSSDSLAGQLQSRATVFFGAASTKAGTATASASNTASLSAVTATVTGCTLYGWALFNSSSGGQRLMYGTFSSSQSMSSGDTIKMAVGGLVLTLA